MFASVIKLIWSPCAVEYTGFIRAIMHKIQGLSRTSKTSPTVFKDLNIMNNTDLSVKMLLQKC